MATIIVWLHGHHFHFGRQRKTKTIKTDTQTGTNRVRHDRLASIKVVPPPLCPLDRHNENTASYTYNACRSFTAK